MSKKNNTKIDCAMCAPTGFLTLDCLLSIIYIYVPAKLMESIEWAGTIGEQFAICTTSAIVALL